MRSGGNVTLSKSTISGNTATGSGGGIHAAEGTVTLTSSTVTGNAGDDGDGNGGGSGIDAQGDLITITSSTISSNTGATGLAVGSGGLTMTQSTVSSNGDPAATGGGIYVEGGAVSITASLINSNNADSGAGVYIDSDVLTTAITDTTIASNIAAETGGGFSSPSKMAKPPRWNSTRSRSTKLPAAVASIMMQTATFSCRTRSSPKIPLVGSGGIGPDIDGVFDSFGNNLIGDGTDGNLVNAVNGDIVGRPQRQRHHRSGNFLGSLASNGGPTKTLSLGSGSKAIDHGVSIAGITTDRTRRQT